MWPVACVARASTVKMPGELVPPGLCEHDQTQVHASSTAMNARPVGETVTTGSQRIWLRADGIVVTANLTPKLLSLEDARENVRAVKKVARGVIRPLFVETTIAAPISVEARDYYVGDEVAQVVSAVGIVVDGAIGRVIGNFVLRRKNARVMMRLFENEIAAVVWLRGFLPPPRGGS
jgi:hypothetical protein